MTWFVRFDRIDGLIVVWTLGGDKELAVAIFKADAAVNGRWSFDHALGLAADEAIRKSSKYARVCALTSAVLKDTAAGRRGSAADPPNGGLAATSDLQKSSNHHDGQNDKPDEYRPHGYSVS